MIRNLYYPMKPLKAEDFTLEQQYGCDARADLAKDALGAGVLRGLQVTERHGALWVGAGRAVDGEGRQIRVPQDTLLTVPEDLLSSGYVTLRYREQPVGPAADTGRAEDAAPAGPRYGRVEETFSLAVRKTPPYDPLPRSIEALLQEQVLIENESVRAVLCAPRFLWAGRGCTVTLRLTARETVREEALWTVSLRLAAPGFFCGGALDGAELRGQWRLVPGQMEELRLCLAPRRADRQPEKPVLLCAAGALQLVRGEMLVYNKRDALFQPAWRGGSPEALYRRALGEAMADSGELPLAHIRPGDRPGATDALWQIRDLRRFAPGGALALTAATLASACPPVCPPAPEPAPAPQPRQASGVVELTPPHGCFQRGQTYYSDWVEHGLGAVPVLAETRCLLPTERGGEQSVCRPQLFAGCTGRMLPDVDTGIRADEAQGRVQLAVYFHKRWQADCFRLRWYVISAENDTETGDGARLTGVHPAQVRLPPGGKTVFCPVFAGKGAWSPCLFRAKGGRMEQDGRFTAPLEPGAYEITVQREGHPEERSYAMAVVEEQS